MHNNTPKKPNTIFQELSARFSCIRKDIQLSHYCTLKVGGPAWAIAEPIDQEELVNVFQYATEEYIPYFIFGCGSNVIPDDRGFKGLVISTRKISTKPKQVAAEILDVSCGQYLPRLVMFCQQLGLSGLEWGIGIPGTVGGSIWMNAGASGSDISSVLEEVTIFDGHKISKLCKEEIKWGYRYSEFQENRKLLILEARLRLVPSSSLSVKQNIEERLEIIKQNQPRSYPSVGTVFKTNRKNLASLGAGVRVGGMLCSDQNPSWIINIENGTSYEIYSLIKKILWKHILRGLPLPTIEPIFIPYDPLRDNYRTNMFNHPPQIVNGLIKILRMGNFLTNKFR